MNKFEMTTEGLLEAQKFLTDIGEGDLIEKELSTDGYTLVALANSVYEKYTIDNILEYHDDEDDVC